MGDVKRVYVLCAVAILLSAFFLYDHTETAKGVQLTSKKSPSPFLSEAKNAHNNSMEVPAGINGSPEEMSHAIDNPLAKFEKERLYQSVERPLFAPSRRRPPPVKPKTTSIKKSPPKKKPNKPKLPTYTLMGVIKGETNKALALLRNRANNRTFRVEVGDFVGRWQVEKIDRRYVKLKMEGRQATLELAR